MDDQISKEIFLRVRWIGQEARIQKIIESAKKEREDWTVHLEGLPFTREIQPLKNEKRGRDLRFARLAGADLKGVDLVDADLRSAILEGANLAGANLQGADLKGVDLKGVDLKGVDLKGPNLAGVDLKDANLRNIDLTGKNLAGVNLEGASLAYSTLSRVNFEGANLSDANLSGANLFGANLERANLERANLKGAYLERANLKRAKFEGASLSDANFSGANLFGANLERANLERANLKGVNLEGADLKGAYFKGANLSDANLSGATLTNANLRDCDFRKANIAGADFSGANISASKVFGIFAWETKAQGIIARDLDFTPDGTGGGEVPAFFRPALPEPREDQLIIEVKGLDSAGKLAEFLRLLEDSFREVCGVERLQIEYIETGSLKSIFKIDRSKIKEYFKALAALLDQKLAKEWLKKKLRGMRLGNLKRLAKFINKHTDSVDFVDKNGVRFSKKKGEKLRIEGDLTDLLEGPSSSPEIF